MERTRFLKLRKLNDPDAAKGKNAKEHDVWGGHGNGGKIYAAKMFDEGFWYTCKDNPYQSKCDWVIRVCGYLYIKERRSPNYS